MQFDPRGPKTMIPVLPDPHIKRPRLTQALDATEVPLTVVAAGPGWGKTVLLSEWAAGRPGTVGWLSLDSGDDHPSAFWSLLLGALPAGATNHPADHLDLAAEAAYRLAALAADPGFAPVTIVIDDAQVLTDPTLLEQLTVLIRAALPGARFVVASRSDPLLPLHRFRMSGQLAEFRAADVGLDGDEIAAMLAAQQVELPPADQRRLAERTQGWTAGVRLSAMRMQGRPDPVEFVSSFALERGSVGEYLTEEVLAQLPAPTRKLLIRSSVAEVVSGGLADAITGGTDGARVLAALAAGNSFITALPPDGRWYRCHPLFREVLRNLLAADDPSVAATAHRRAAIWSAEHGRPATAVRHATRSGNWSLTARLVVDGGWEDVVLRGHGPPEDLAPLVDVPLGTLPVGAAHRFLTARALAATATGRWSIVREALDRLALLDPAGADPAEVRLASGARLLLGHVDGDLAAVETFAAQLTAGPDDLLATWATLIRGEARYWSQHYPEATSDLERVADRAVSQGVPATAVRALGMLTMTATSTGLLDLAAEFAARGATVAKEGLSAGQPHPAGPAASGLRGAAGAALDLGGAYLAAMRGDEATVARLLSRVGTELAGLDAVEPAMVAGSCMIRAHLLVRQQRGAEAWALLQATPITAEPSGYHLPVVRRWLLAEIMLQLEQPTAAAEHLPFGRDPDLRGRLTQARLALVRGDTRQADALVRSVITAASPAPDLETLIVALLLRAESEQTQGFERDAVESVNRALDLAESPALSWSFGMATKDLVALVRRHPQLSSRWPTPLAVEGATSSPAVGRSPVVPDGLTDRELTVLRWLTTSMTTAEIAEELCVSVNTMKTHIGSLYRKLGAGRRRDAIAVARERRLI